MPTHQTKENSNIRSFRKRFVRYISNNRFSPKNKIQVFGSETFRKVPPFQDI